MKLNEIIDTEITKEKSGNLDASKNKLIGAGFYSTVYDNDEWTVSKEQKWDDDENFPKDGYNFYIDYLIRNNLMGTNPFFPRVYKIKKYRVNNKTYYTYDIEKLTPLEDASATQLKYMFYYLFGFEENKLSKDMLLSRIINGMRGAIERNTPVVYNEQFSMAIKILNDIRKKIRLYDKSSLISWDLIAKNFMMRLTNNAPQIVITDPFG